MGGKRDEVLAKRAKAREERDKKKNETSSNGPSASGIHHDKSGQAYIMDSVSGQAILLASANDSSVPTTALAAFEPPTDSIYTSMSTVDRFEYDALFLDDHSASINWYERRRSVSANDALVASIIPTLAPIFLCASDHSSLTQEQQSTSPPIRLISSTLSLSPSEQSEESEVHPSTPRA